MFDGPAQPPLGGVAPPLQCNRVMNGSFEDPDHCGRPATWHIIWTMDAENGVSCDEHAEEARRKWVYAGMHPYSEVCSMPGAVWLHAEDVCVTDEGLAFTGELAVAEPELTGIHAATINDPDPRDPHKVYLHLGPAPFHHHPKEHHPVMSTDTLTSEQKLATAILGQNVCEWIADQRSPEPDLERSWRKIAENLAAATDGQVEVSGQTVRRWSTDHAKALNRRAGEVEWQEPPLPLRPPA